MCFPQSARTGKGVLEQMVHRLAEYKKYALPEMWGGERLYAQNPEDLPEAVHRIQINGGNLDLPPNILRYVEIKSTISKAVFEGYTVTTK